MRDDDGGRGGAGALFVGGRVELDVKEGFDAGIGGLTCGFGGGGGFECAIAGLFVPDDRAWFPELLGEGFSAS